MLPTFTMKGSVSMKERQINLDAGQIKPGDNEPLTFLDSRQVLMVDEALSSVGEYGEVRLVVEKGRLRFIVTNRSYDALSWQPGSILP